MFDLLDLCFILYALIVSNIFSDAPERYPECSWEIVNEPLDVLFICSWNGGYPVPTLDWHEVHEEHVIAKGPTVNSTSQETERLEVHVNGFILNNGEEVKCIGHHVTGVESSCSFKLRKTISLPSVLFYLSQSIDFFLRIN